MSASSAAFDGSTEVALQIGALALLFVAGSVTTGKRFVQAPIYCQSWIYAALVLLFFCASFLSSIFAEDKALSVSYVCGIAVAFLICGAVWNLSLHVISRGLKAYAVMVSVCAAGIWSLTPNVGHRFGGVMHPNYWGLLCLSVFCLAALFQNIAVRSTVQIVSIAVVLAAQSRSALLSILAASSVFGAIWLKTVRIRKEFKLMIVAAAGLGSFVFAVFAYQELYDIVSNVFMINDVHRGAGTGFTGRTALWRAGLEVFASHPWFGVGARMESYFISVAGFSHAHNGYINMLVQFGVIGSGFFIALSLLATKRLFKLAVCRAPGANVGIAFLCGYAVGAIFEPRLINIGNSVSLIMIMFLLRPFESRPPNVPKTRLLQRVKIPRGVQPRYALHGS